MKRKIDIQRPDHDVRFLLRSNAPNSVVTNSIDRSAIVGNSGMTTGYSKVYPWFLLLTELPTLSSATMVYVTFVPTGSEGIVAFHISPSRLVILTELVHVSLLLVYVQFKITCSSEFTCVTVVLTLTMSVENTLPSAGF